MNPATGNDMTLSEANELRRLFNYDADTGLFVRSVNAGNAFPSGSVAGTTNKKGYVVILFLGKYRKAHRLAWLYTYGEWPSSEIDHINMVKDDNRICNLRLSSRKENTMNRSMPRRDNKSGFLGVSRRGNKFISRIVEEGTQKYLGTYETPEDAAAAYLSAKAGMTS